MAQNSVVSIVKSEKGARGEGKWTINNWNTTHKIVAAAEANCYVEFGNSKLGLRFFLRPKEKFLITSSINQVQCKWYSLMAEVLTQVEQNAVIKVTANVESDKHWLLTKDGTITHRMFKGKFYDVIDPFLFFESCNVDKNGQLSDPHHFGFKNPTGFPSAFTITDVTITITAELYRLNENGKTVAPLDTGAGENLLAEGDPLDTGAEENLLAEGEESIIHDLKNMFVAHQNYADLKLESKDHMTLDAHKFILAARSRYLAKCIEGAMKIENFNGTIKININGKPLVVILHWIYTGELHENAGNVMEEVVDAAILFELTHLMKVLDKKLITICNKENMFRLYQVAQKNGMPNAMDAISVYIRENL